MNKLLTIISICLLALPAWATEYSYETPTTTFDLADNVSFKVDYTNHAIQIVKISPNTEAVVELPNIATDESEAEYRIVSLLNKTNIATNIFGGPNSVVTKITLGSNIESIGERALAVMSKLETIVCNATTPPALHEDAFYNSSKLAEILVPASSLNAYKEAWAAYADIISAIPESGSTAIDDITTTSDIRIEGRRIVSDVEQQIEVYSVTGAVVYRGYTSTVELPKAGLYIVKYDDNVKKVLCK